MQQSASQEGPGVLNEQGIMKAKRRSQTGSKMTGHNSACMWMISMPKLRKLGIMCRKASMSTARQFKACDHLRDKMHVSTTARLIGCKAQLVQQPSNQPSKAGMLLYMYWQHAERKAGLSCEGTTARLISCKAQLVQQPSNQPSKAGMLLYMYWQHAERKAGLSCEGYLWRYDNDRNCQVLEPRPTSLLSAPGERVPYDSNELEKAC